MRVAHDIMEVVIAIGVMAMFMAVFSMIDLSSAKKKDPDPGVPKDETVYVNASYTGNNENGSYKHPFNTIQEGIDAAVSGQTVLVEPGIYYGAVELKSGVLLRSRSGPEFTIIDGDGASMAVMSPYAEAPEARIEGFTIRNADYLIDIRNRVHIWSWASIDISDCIFYGGIRGVFITAGAITDIKRAVFTDLFEAISGLWNFHMLLKNGTIDKVDYAFSLYDSEFQVFNTTISRSGCVARMRGGDGILYTVSGSNNNICSCTVMTEPSPDGTYPDICFDVMFEENPMFVNPDAVTPEDRDYRLQAGSPLIDMGVDVGLPYNGAAPDIGAYEYVPPGVAPLTEFETAAYPVNYMLPESYASTVIPEYRDEGERLRNVIQTTVVEVTDGFNGLDPSMPVQQQLDALMALRDRLALEVLARADGHYGGNATDDWITTKTGQYKVVSRVDKLIQRIDERINALLALAQ